MRIGIDARMLSQSGGQLTGIGQYAFQLVRALVSQREQSGSTATHDYVLLVDQATPVVQEFAASAGVKVIQPPLVSVRRYLPFVYAHVLTAWALRRARLDVFHATATSVPLLYTGATVVTVHDLAIYTHPEWFPPRQWLSTRVVVPRSVRRARQVIAVSQATANEVVRLFGVPAARVNVVYEAADALSASALAPIPADVERVRAKLNGSLTTPFILSIGTLEPRKNMARVVEAFARVAKASTNWHMVIAGGRGWNYESIDRAVAKSGCAERIHLLGYVTEEEKCTLFAAAQVFAFPSLYEGFGLPVLEAMHAGVPVLTSAAGALPEVAGEAAVLVDPLSVQDIARGLEALMTSAEERKQYAEAGQRQAQKFSWARCAQETMTIYTKTI